MKRVMFFVMVVCLVQTGVWIGQAQSAIMSWEGVTTYTDGMSIDPNDIPDLRYHPFTGPTAQGPWTEYEMVSVTSVVVPDPASGQTLWYTVEASFLGELRSEKAAAVSKTVPFPPVAAPSGLRVN